MPIIIDGQNLRLDQVAKVARLKCKVEISKDAKARLAEAFALVSEKIAKKEAAYGITTGFGDLSQVIINSSENKLLQKNLIISHACAVGPEFDTEVVRAIMLLRINTLVKGFSGINPQVVLLLLELLNRDIIPRVPSQGSLGASGDLANLAHVALALIAKGDVYYQGELLPAKEVLATEGLEPVVLEGKDGLALINGTQVMTALAALAVVDSQRLMETATAAASLSMEALLGFTAAFDPRIHELRGHRGQMKVARDVLKFLQASPLVNTRKGDVQDSYTLRCVPQVHGASLDALAYVKAIVEKEVNAVTDNPLVFPETKEVISGGNFHGQPIAIALDFLGIAVAEIANISERRVEKLVNPRLNGDLPPFLVKESGLNSGHMIIQYTAASLVSENKVLAHPASVDSIPSSANKEDHVSMGTIAARKLAKIVKNTNYVLAIELLAAAQAIDIIEPKSLGLGTKEVYAKIREVVTYLEEDRVLYKDIEALLALSKSEEFQAICQKYGGLDEN